MTTSSDSGASGHTKPPWRQENKVWADGRIERHIHANRGRARLSRIASVYGADGYPGEADANARLIIAAPALLELVETTTDVRDGECYRLGLPVAETCAELAEADRCWPCRARALLASLEVEPARFPEEGH